MGSSSTTSFSAEGGGKSFAPALAKAGRAAWPLIERGQIGGTCINVCPYPDQDYGGQCQAHRNGTPRKRDFGVSLAFPTA